MKLTWLKAQLRPLLSRALYIRLALGYLVLVLLLVAFQRQLLFRPTVLTREEFSAEIAGLAQGSPEILEPFDAVVLQPVLVPVVGTAILFHGNTGNATDRGVLAHEFLSRGYRLVLAEYPGYAARKGSPSEEAIVEDAQNLYHAIRKKFPVEQVIVVGESLGSAVAVQVAAKVSPQPENLLLITPFTSFASVAAKQIWFLPARYLVRDQFESAKHLARYTGPVSMLVASKDEVVSQEEGLALFDVATKRGPSKLIQLVNAGHNNWWPQTTAADWSWMLNIPVEKPQI